MRRAHEESRTLPTLIHESNRNQRCFCERCKYTLDSSACCLIHGEWDVRSYFELIRIQIMIAPTTRRPTNITGLANLCIFIFRLYFDYYNNTVFLFGWITSVHNINILVWRIFMWWWYICISLYVRKWLYVGLSSRCAAVSCRSHFEIYNLVWGIFYILGRQYRVLCVSMCFLV